MIALRACAVTAALALIRSTVAAPAFDLNIIDDLPEASSIDQSVASATVDPSAVAASVIATAVPAIQTELAQGAAEAAADGNLRKRATSFLTDYTGGSDPTSFKNYQPWISNAAAGTAAGFTQVYTGQKSTRGNIPGLLGVYVIDSYSPEVCSTRCKSNKFCASFALWYERTPSVAPTQTNQNPDPAYWTKCLTYSYPLNKADATNDGQWSYKFYRTQVGAAFYNSDTYAPPKLAGYDAPVALPGAIYLTQQDVNNNNGVDPLVTTPGPIVAIPDPAVCQKLCDGYTADKTFYNGVQKACNFFNIFELSLNGQSRAFQCQYYTDAFGVDHATNTGGYDEKGNRVDVIRSWGYTANPLTTPSVVRQAETYDWDTTERAAAGASNVYTFGGDRPGQYHVTKIDGFNIQAFNRFGGSVLNAWINDPTNGQPNIYTSYSATPSLIFEGWFGNLNADGFTFDLTTISAAPLTIGSSLPRNPVIYGYRNGQQVAKLGLTNVKASDGYKTYQFGSDFKYLDAIGFGGTSRDLDALAIRSISVVKHPNSAKTKRNVLWAADRILAGRDGGADSLVNITLADGASYQVDPTVCSSADVDCFRRTGQ